MHYILALTSLFGLSWQDDLEKTIQALIQRLGAEKIEERIEASQDLRHLGDKAVAPLEQALKSEDAEVRRRAAEVIGRIRWGSRMSPHLEEAVGDTIFNLLGSPEPQRRIQGVSNLARVLSETHSRDSQVFRFLLHDPSYQVAREAYSHLSWRGTDRMLIDGLVAMLGTAGEGDAEADSGAEISSIVDRLLGVMTSRDRVRVAPLVKTERDPGRLCGQALSLALGDSSVGPQLLKTLEGPEWKARIALQCLSRSPQPKYADALGKLLGKNETASDLRALSALALARLGEKPDARTLLAWAHGKDDATAIPALRALGLLDDEKAVKELLAAHKRGGTIKDVRGAAVLEMVAQLDKLGGYEALFDAVREDPFLAHPLRALGESNRLRLLKALLPLYLASGSRDLRLTSLRTEYEGDPSPEFTALAVKILEDPARAREHGAAARLVFRPLSPEQERVVKAYLVEQGKKDLGRVGPPNGRLYIALPELLPIARERLREGCDPQSLKLIALWGDKSDIPRVREKVEGVDDRTKVEVLATLAKLGDVEVSEKLIERMKNPATVQSAATQLEYVWSKALAERLKALLDDERYRPAWWWILEAFNSTGDRSLIPRYRDFLKDKDDLLRSWATRMAGEWGDSGARDRLRELIQDQEIRVKVHALRSLAILGDVSVEQEILKLCGSEEDFVVTECIEGLGALKTPSAIRMLLRLAHTQGDYQYGNALAALVKCGAPESLGPARVILDAGTSRALNLEGAFSAIQRLGEVADAERVYPFALKGDPRALRALDATIHRNRYAALKGKHRWREIIPLDQAVAKISERYGIAIALGEKLRESLAFRSRPWLWGDRDIYGGVELLTHPTMECAPIFDGDALRLVTVAEAVAYWSAHPARK